MHRIILLLLLPNICYSIAAFTFDKANFIQNVKNFQQGLLLLKEHKKQLENQLLEISLYKQNLAYLKEQIRLGLLNAKSVDFTKLENTYTKISDILSMHKQTYDIISLLSKNEANLLEIYNSDKNRDMADKIINEQLENNYNLTTKAIETLDRFDKYDIDIDYTNKLLKSIRTSNGSLASLQTGNLINGELLKNSIALKMILTNTQKFNLALIKESKSREIIANKLIDKFNQTMNEPKTTITLPNLR